MANGEEPERIPVLDSELAEQWVRRTDEPDVRAVGATKTRRPGKWPWRVSVSAAEFVREDPLEREMRTAIGAALRAVTGVERVVEEDREVWAVAGDPTGEALVRAAAGAIDLLQDKIRAHMNPPGSSPPARPGWALGRPPRGGREDALAYGTSVSSGDRMAYVPLVPPLSLDLRKKNQAQLVAYREWFLGALPARIAQLSAAIRERPSHEHWEADFTRGSLETLGAWFFGEVAVRKVATPTTTLTARTWSLATDIGMYFGCTMGRVVSRTHWEQKLGPKFDADYGHMVVIGFQTPLNPVRIAVVVASNIAAKTDSAARLGEVFDRWSSRASPV